MLRLNEAKYISLLFNFILSVRLSNSIWVLDVPLFLEFIYIVSILFFYLIEFIILSYTLLVISFSRYKEHIICLVSFSKSSAVFSAFTCASAVGNLWSICLVVNILSCWSSKTLTSQTLAMQARQSEILVNTFSCFLLGNIPLSKALKVFVFH